MAKQDMVLDGLAVAFEVVKRGILTWEQAAHMLSYGISA